MYKIDRKGLKLQKIMTFLPFGGFLIIFFIIASFFFSMKDEMPKEVILFFGVVVVLLITTLIKKICFFKNKEKEYEYLERHGRLAKNAQFSIVPTGKYKYGEKVTKVIIHDENCTFDNIDSLDYGMEDNGIARFINLDKLPDVLYDPEDPTNYFVACEIKEV